MQQQMNKDASQPATCLDWGGNLRLMKDTPKAEEDVETPHTGFSEVVTAEAG